MHFWVNLNWNFFQDSTLPGNTDHDLSAWQPTKLFSLDHKLQFDIKKKITPTGKLASKNEHLSPDYDVCKNIIGNLIEFSLRRAPNPRDDLPSRAPDERHRGPGGRLRGRLRGGAPQPALRRGAAALQGAPHVRRRSRHAGGWVGRGVNDNKVLGGVNFFIMASYLIRSCVYTTYKRQTRVLSGSPNIE